MLQRNPNYWKHDSSGKQLPYIDSVRGCIQQNRDLEPEHVLSGDADTILKLSPASFDRVDKAKPGAARSLGPSFDSESVWFNESPAKTLPEWKRAWFRSAAFRHAVSLAINRDDIARIVYNGRAHPSAGPVSPADRFWFNAALKPLPFDPDAASKSLADDGFKLRDGVLRDRAGHAVEFSLITNAGNAPREHMAPLIQSDLAKLGIKVNTVSLDFNSLVDRLTKSFDYEAVLLSINIEADPLEAMNVWMSSGSHHAWWISEKSPATPWEARIDELEKFQASSGSRDARKKAFDEVQRIAVEQEPIIYLVNPDYLCAIAPRHKRRSAFGNAASGMVECRMAASGINRILEFRISARYGAREVLRDLTGHIAANEIVALVGLSGAGKSTLALSLLRLLRYRGRRSHRAAVPCSKEASYSRWKP